ncbi:MAG: DUF58 domain-containing protein, partial [Gemmataceae bacterium]|nr:DUF58 domain-containing protein [Gemmataceae bacterium]
MGWLVAVGAIVGIALALQAGLAAFAGYVVLGSYLLSRWLSRQWIENVEAQRHCPSEPLEVGASVEVELQVRHTGRWPTLWVLAEDLFADEYLQQRPPAVQIKGHRLQLI